MYSVVKRFADGRSEKLRVALVKESGVWTINWVSEIGVEQRFQEYVVSFYGKNSLFTGSWGDFLEIMRGNDRVFEIYMDEGHRSIELGLMGKDITDDGKPNLVIWTNDGGSAGTTATYKDYSDTLAIFFLKGLMPDKYRENKYVEHGGEIKLTPDEAFLEISERAKRKAPLYPVFERCGL